MLTGLYWLGGEDEGVSDESTAVYKGTSTTLIAIHLKCDNQSKESRRSGR